MDLDWLYILFVAVILPCFSYFGGKWYYGRKQPNTLYGSARKSNKVYAVLFIVWHLVERAKR